MAAGTIEGPWALPEGWRWATAGEAYPLSYGKSLSAKHRESEGAIPVYGSSGAVGKHSEACIDGPSIIIGRKGAAGSVHFCESPSWPIDTAYFAHGSQEADIRFGYHLLTWLRLGRFDQSTAIPSLSRDSYDPLLVPLPPIKTQQRIAARIDELFTELDDGEAALSRARDDLETYRKSLLKAAVTGELTADWRAANPPQETGDQLLQRILGERKARWEADPRNRTKRYNEPLRPKAINRAAVPSGWALVTIDQISLHVTKGSSPGWQGFEYQDDGILFVRSQNVGWGELRLQDRVYVDASFNEVESKAVIEKGDVLLNIVGASIGRACSAPTVLRGANSNQAVAGIRPVRLQHSEFLATWLLSPMGQDSIFADVVETARANLSLNQIRNFAFSMPPEDELPIIQERLAQATETLQASSIESLKAKQSELRQSILSAAFRGELIQ